MDINLLVLFGHLAANPELRVFDSGKRLVRLLVTVQQDQPRRRVDVIPVSYWEPDNGDPVEFDAIANLAAGDRVQVTGSVQRRFWEAVDNGGHRSRLEVVAEYVAYRVPEEVSV